MLAKPKSPLPREIFQCLWKKKVFLPKPLKRWLCRPVSRREIVRQTPQTGEVVVQSCVQRSATCVDVCRGLWRIASAPLVTLLRVKFLSRIILFCDLLITMPYLTSSLGQMDFCTIYNDHSWRASQVHPGDPALREMARGGAAKIQRETIVAPRSHHTINQTFCFFSWSDQYSDAGGISTMNTLEEESQKWGGKWTGLRYLGIFNLYSIQNMLRKNLCDSPQTKGEQPNWQ